MKLVQKAEVNDVRFQSIVMRYVYSLNGVYEMAA